MELSDYLILETNHSARSWSPTKDPREFSKYSGTNTARLLLWLNRIILKIS